MKYMECFINEKGLERKAKLEDILPLLGISLQFILRDTFNYDYLPYAIAHLPDEMKNLVYSNSLLRIRGKIEKKVLDVEFKYDKNDSLIQDARAQLISFIGENIKLPPWYLYNDFVWKETKQKKPSSPFEKLTNEIENACASGRLYLSVFDTKKISEEDVKNAFMTFQDQKDKLQKIRILQIDIEELPSASLLFEAGGIEELEIFGKFNGIWPDFLENNRNLTSIGLRVEGLTEFPAWIRKAVSLRCLSIEKFDDSLPDWIGDMQSLTKINVNLKTFPDSIGNLKNLTELYIYNSVLDKLPDSIGDLSSLKEFHLNGNKNLKSLPDSIGNLKNLSELRITNSVLDKLPDSIGDLSFLKELHLNGNKNLKSLPDRIGNLKNLVGLSISDSVLEKLPDSIGDLSSLIGLFLQNNKNLTSLPDSIGNLRKLTKISLEGSKIENLPESIDRLKNLTMLNLCRSSLKKLPDTITDCTSLECLDIRKTDITSFPDSISSIKELKRTIEVIPKKRSISYLSFCNYYYTLVDTIIRFSYKARFEGLLSWEEEMDSISDDFFKEGIRLVLDGVDVEIIQNYLAIKIERESDSYKKKLMEITLESILYIKRGDSINYILLMISSMVDIKNNPLDTACAKYLNGDYYAFDSIDLKAAIQPEAERKEIRFIKHAFEIIEIKRSEGIIGIEQYLDYDNLAAKDIFEYGISMIVVGIDYKDIDKILTMLISHETDPVRKNLALIKKKAVEILYNDYNPGIAKKSLLAYFNDEIADEFLSELDEEQNER